MSEIDWSVVSAITSAVAAISAIVAPVITAVFTLRSQERMKKQELYSPRVYDALAEMSEAYSSLIRKDYSGEDMDTVYMRALEKFSHFTASCYKVMALIPDEDIHGKISKLLMDQQTVYPSVLHDAAFLEIMADINASLHSGKIKAWFRKKRLAKQSSKGTQ